MACEAHEPCQITAVFDNELALAAEAGPIAPLFGTLVIKTHEIVFKLAQAGLKTRVNLTSRNQPPDNLCFTVGSLRFTPKFVQIVPIPFLWLAEVELNLRFKKSFKLESLETL